MHYLLSYYEAQSDSVSIKALSVLDKPKEFKQFVLVFVFNSNSCVYHRDFHKFLYRMVLLNLLYDFNFGLDLSLLSEFQCVSVKT